MESTHVVTEHPYPSYEEWIKTYQNELKSMFTLFENEFKEEFNINIEVFNKFCKFIYKHSSKETEDESI